MGQEIAGFLQELQRLATRKPPSQEELKKAKDLMRVFRRSGFTNREVSELADGGWSEATVKLYTRGSKTGDTHLKKRLTDLFKELVNRNLWLDEVDLALSAIAAIEDQGLNLGDVTLFLGEVKGQGLTLKNLLETQHEIANAHLTIQQLNEILSYKNELQTLAVTVDGLRTVCQISKRYGGYQALLTAIQSYGTLKSIEEASTRLKLERSKIEKEAAGLASTVKDLEIRKNKITEELQLHKTLENEGYNLSTLRKIKNVSDKYGGIKDFLSAVEIYPSSVKLRNEISTLEKQKVSIESDLKKTEADHSHLKRVIGISEKLLNYGFEVSAVDTLYELAKGYGDAFTVLEAIRKYNKLSNIQQEINGLSTKKTELHETINQMKEEVQRLTETKEKTIASIAELSRTLGQIDQKVAETKEVLLMLNLIERPIEVKEPIVRVLTLALTEMNSLKTYVETHEYEITSPTLLKIKLKEVSDLLGGHVRDELRRTA